MLDSRFTDEDLDDAQGASADPEDEIEQEADGTPRTPKAHPNGRQRRSSNKRRESMRSTLRGSSAGSPGCGTTCSALTWRPNYKMTLTR